MRRSKRWLVLLLGVAACQGAAPGPAADVRRSESALDGDGCPTPDDELPAPEDFMSPTRVLRRMTVSLRGSFPTVAEYEELLAQPEASRESWLQAKGDELLADPAFYDRMFEFALEWINLPPLANIADRPEYGLDQQRTLRPCEEGTLHAGALHNASNGVSLAERVCNGEAYTHTNGEDYEVLVTDVEPWWAPGTSVRLVGQMADLAPTIDGVDCGLWQDGTGRSDAHLRCGCGPHALYCTPDAAWPQFIVGNPEGQRRMMWEEPARLFAHLVWHERSMNDLILANYTVGTRESQAAYVRYGRRTGAVALDEYEDWWRSDRWSSPTDPHHETTDPLAWSEFRVSTRNPYFLDERDTRFDPRHDDPSELRGVPTAGMLTSLGVVSSWTRERVRGARLLEVLACEVFDPPPSDQHFNEYIDDPGAQGPCQHCHARIDPASIHFKRFTRYGNRFVLLGVGGWHFPNDRWTTGTYPYGGDPWERIVRLWTPGTRMTPVSAADYEANPESIWVDYLPSEQTLYGQRSDGTIGPLGFGKMLAASGAFDRCLVRRVHEAIVGRDINPVTEAGYLGALVEQYVAGGRVLRPFVRELLQTDAFRRGLQ